MIIRFLTGAYKALRIVFGTSETIHAKRNDAKKLATLPMAQLVPLLMARLNGSAAGWKGQLRLPAAYSAIDVNLPAEVEEFYRVCDGIASLSGDFPLQILPRSALRLGTQHDKLLSAHLRKYWLKHGRASGEREAVQVFPANDLLALLADQEELLLPFSALDQCVPLGSPSDGIYPLLLVSPMAGMPAGTILEVEGQSATRYSNFQSWLAHFATLFV